MSYFKVYDKQEKHFLEPIYRAYKGEVFDFYLGSSGTLTFRCEGMQNKGFPNGYTHESIITKGKNRFEIIINKQEHDSNILDEFIAFNDMDDEHLKLIEEYRELRCISIPTLNEAIRMKEIMNNLLNKIDIYVDEINE